MQKSHTIAIFSSLLLVAGSSACTQFLPNDSVIGINSLYAKPDAYEDIYENNTGNVLLAKDQTLLFFNPLERRKLRSIITGKTTHEQIQCLRFLRSEKPVVREQLEAKRVDGIVRLGPHPISESELERLKLTEDWERVIANKGLFPTDSSIVRLSPNQFLITGGRSSLVDDSKRLDPGKLAFIYDSASNQITKKFELKQHRYHHLSLLLPGGEVLLLDGNYMERFNPRAELVNPVSGKTILFKDVSEISRSGATAYVDSLGGCILMGGTRRGRELGIGTLPVERINIQHQSYQTIASLTVPRYFEFYNVGDIPINVIPLQENRLLISGGTSFTGIYGRARRTDAEIVQIGKLK